MFKKAGNPRVEEIQKTYTHRSYNLSSLKAVIIEGKRFCAWCGVGQLHHGNQKYCTPSCSYSATASFYPQKEEGLSELLIRQDYKCNICQHDWAPLAEKIADAMHGGHSYNEKVDFKKDFSWSLIKRLKNRVEKEHHPEVDHIIPIYKGGQSLGLDNHQAICYTCHKTKTAKDLSGKRKKNEPTE